jgi:deoxyribodipyrimidine photo-lyase
VAGVRVLVLFTRDLRVRDHPALWEACGVASEIVPLFVVDPALMGRSPNRARFITECLVELDRALKLRGGRLFTREGDVAATAVEAAVETGCREIFVTSDVGATAAHRSERLGSLAAGHGIRLRTFPGHAVVEPGAVAPHGARAYRVFTPYLHAWSSAARRPQVGTPRAVRVPPELRAGRLPIPGRSRPTALELPPGGEAAGRKRMQRFLSRGAGAYGEGRNDLAGDRTSRLSPYLRFGCISASELAANAYEIAGAQEFVRQLAWRDFFHQLMAEHPSMSRHDLRDATDEPAPVDDAIVAAWIEGRTGLPLVDAGMRQLAQEGWMHNRARLVTASFLTRRAGVPWQVGAAHFSHHLVDGDPANNAGNWQWVAGTGAAGRRSRPLNPARQAERFDRDGVFVRRYVPELAGVEGHAVLAPWRHPELRRATGYPAPILNVAD